MDWSSIIEEPLDQIVQLGTMDHSWPIDQPASASVNAHVLQKSIRFLTEQNKKLVCGLQDFENKVDQLQRKMDENQSSTLSILRNIYLLVRKTATTTPAATNANSTMPIPSTSHVTTATCTTVNLLSPQNHTATIVADFNGDGEVKIGGSNIHTIPTDRYQVAFKKVCRAQR